MLASLPDFPGKRRLAKLLYGSKLRNKSDIEIPGKFGTRFKVPNLRENIAFDIFVNGIYEPDIIHCLNGLLPHNGKFLDLGANIGAILIPLCKQRPDIRALGIEAAPWIYEYLSDNLERNKISNAIVLNNALFDKDDVQLDFFSPRDKFGKGSLSPVFEDQGVKVISRRIDTILTEQKFGKPDLIKADVEGFEYFVFKGGEALLTAQDAPDILFEFVDWAEERAQDLKPGDAQRLLLDFGFNLFTFEKGKFQRLDGVLTSGAANIFASKKRKV
ncbi:MAG: FkbM family methyltransferase [Sphingobacteriales bacterium]|nr:MAG: FkbM family methyltransferase [Sphingobacteriales bacterium]